MRVGHYYKEMILYPTFILSSLVLSLFWVPHHANQRFSLGGRKDDGGGDDDDDGGGGNDDDDGGDVDDDGVW